MEDNVIQCRDVSTLPLTNVSRAQASSGAAVTSSRFGLGVGAMVCGIVA